MIENFGTRFKRQEMVSQFFNLHDEENKNYQQRVDSYLEIREDIGEFEHFDSKTLSHIRERLEARSNCPLCQNELLNEELEEKYCPSCYE
jgi:hypothetical protein